MTLFCSTVEAFCPRGTKISIKSTCLCTLPLDYFYRSKTVFFFRLLLISFLFCFFIYIFNFDLGNAFDRHGRRRKKRKCGLNAPKITDSVQGSSVLK